jgi:hypothetical protein
MCVRRLKARLEYGLGQDERDQRKEDNDYLNRIAIDQIRFETPDNPAGNAEMQGADIMLEQIGGGNIDVAGAPARIFTRTSMAGL